MAGLLNEINKINEIPPDDGTTYEVEEGHESLAPSKSYLLKEVESLKKQIVSKNAKIEDLYAIQLHKDEESRIMIQQLKQEIRSHVNWYEAMQKHRKENEKLVKVNNDLTETIQVMEAVDNPSSQDDIATKSQSEGCISDVEDVSIDGSKHAHEETTRPTMIKRIKARTEAATRKFVNATNDEKQPIDLDDYELDYTISNKYRPKTRGMNKVPINNRYKAVKATTESTKLHLQEHWSVDRENTRVWYFGSRLELRVTMEDVMLLLHDGRVSGQVINCWGKLLLTVYEKQPIVKHTLLFSSHSWDCVHLYGDSKKSKWLYDTIDARLEEEVGEDSILLFPMITKGEERFPQGDHWTMIILDMVNCE